MKLNKKKIAITVYNLSALLRPAFIAAAAAFMILTCCVIKTAAFDLVVFNNDSRYLSREHYLNAKHYEVNKIINIDNTRENLIVAPASLKYDKKYNRLLVGDYLSGKIRKYSLNTFKYSGDFEVEAPGKKIMGSPFDIYISNDSKSYVVADIFFNRIVFFNHVGLVTDAIGATGEAAGEFSEPAAVTYSNGLFFVADKYNCRICVYDRRGYFKYSFASKGTLNSQLYLPVSLKANDSGEIYICDSGNDRVQVFSHRGAYIKTIGRRGRSAGFFDVPSDICFDSNSNIYVADSYNKRVQKFSPSGEFLCEIKSPGSSFLSDDYKPDFYFKMPKNYDSNEINFSLGSFVMPVKIDINNQTAQLYVLDSAQKKIFILDCDNFNKGRALYLGRNFKDAVNYLNIVIDENPHNLNAFYYLGFSYQQIHDYKKAYECYKKIINYHSLGDVEKHARLQLKIITSINPPGYFKPVEEKAELEKNLAKTKSSYANFIDSTDEITAFDRKRDEYFAVYEIRLPSRQTGHEKSEDEFYDNEYYNVD